jgi:hypothetical protein
MAMTGSVTLTVEGGEIADRFIDSGWQQGVVRLGRRIVQATPTASQEGEDTGRRGPANHLLRRCWCAHCE